MMATSSFDIHDLSQSNGNTSDSRHVNRYTFKILKSLCNNNLRYFKNDKSEVGHRFEYGFSTMKDLIDTIELQVDGIEKIVRYFDVDEDNPGNGFRSCLMVIDKCLQTTVKLSKNICLKRNALLFRKLHYLKELENIVSVLGSLYEGTKHIKKLLVWNKKGELYPEDHQTAEDLLFEVECIDQASFYGRSVGFQFCESLHNPILFLSILMASFCDGYLKNGNMISKAATSVLNATKYTIDPETRAQRIVQLSQNASSDLVKAYWGLAESIFVTHVPNLLTPPPAVNKVIEIPVQFLEMPRSNGKGNTTIPTPRSYLKPAPIPCRLLSFVLREGQLTDEEKKTAGLSNTKNAPKSRDLIIHVHGGGFLAMSSKSHEVYLREWAKELDVPIFSIDYTLSPEAPYPRALEECFMAYCWALMNCHQLGSTAERVIVVGDSAGGNLVCALTLKCIRYGIRIPDGLICIYTPFIMRAMPSPSRFLSAFDPFLPIGFLLCVLTAYAGLEIPVGKIYNTDGTTTELVSATPPKSPISPTKDKQNISDGSKNSDNKFSLQFLSSEDDEDNLSIDEQIANKYSELDKNSSKENFLKIDPDKDLESVILSPVPKSYTFNSSTSSELTNNELPSSGDNDGDYVNKFLNEYINKHSLQTESSQGNEDADEQILFELSSILPSVKSVPHRIFISTKNLIRDISEYLLPQKSIEPPMARKRTISRPFLDHPSAIGLRRFATMDISTDPFMSPYFAPDDMLKEMPPVYLESPHLDPIMDDSVMFAKRLRAVNKPVIIDFFEEVPHAFLNFITLSKECKDCNKRVMMRIRQALDLVHRQN